jgi:Flp pilus assembly protein TadD
LGLLGLLLIIVAGCGGEDSSEPRPGKAKRAAGKDARAIAAKEGALLGRLEENPDDLEATLELANLYYDTGRPRLAVAAYKDVLKAQPDNPSVRTDLGTCYKRMGKLDLAREQYQTVLENHPGHIQATYNLAVVSELMGDLGRAAALWERVAGMAPETPIARISMRHATAARAKLATKDTPQAPAKTKESSP